MLSLAQLASLQFAEASTAACKLYHTAHSTSGLQGALGGNKQKRTEADLITVEDIVKHHWQEFGRSAAQMVPAQGCPLSNRPAFLKLVPQFCAQPRQGLAAAVAGLLCAVLCTGQAQVVL